MLEANSGSIKKFIESFLGSMLFGDLPAEQREGLKEFLINFLNKLYNENIKDIIKIIDQLNSISPFMVKLALGYGILEEDVIDIIKILFIKINEYFYKKGSLENIQGVNRILEYYGIESEIKKVLYNKSKDTFLLEDIYSGEVTETDIKEFAIPGHYISHDDYSTYTFEDNYQTIVIYIKMNIFVAVSKDMHTPVALLHAYTISKHRNDLLYYSINNAARQQNLESFLFFMQYYYFKYIKFKYSDFELDEKQMRVWNLVISDPDDMNLIKEILENYLAGEYDNRNGQAYFERVSAQILNKYSFDSKSLTLDDLSKKAHDLDDQLATMIDNVSTEEEFIHNINNTIIYIDNYINKFPTISQLDQMVQSTMRYLLMYIIFLMIADFGARIKKLILKFKKYFLPIYMHFYFEENRALIIKNLHHRIFIEENILQYIRSAPSGVIDPRDQQTAIIGPVRRDKNIAIDSFKQFIRTQNQVQNTPKDKIFTKSRLQLNSMLDSDDKQNVIVTTDQNDRTDISDSVTVTVTND